MNTMITVAKNSNNLEFLRYAYDLGIRDFRVNMDYEQEAIRALQNIKSLPKNKINIFADFQGVKQRIQLQQGISEIPVKEGELIRFYLKSDYYPYIKHYELPKGSVVAGDTLTISDGKIQGKVISVKDEYIEVKFSEVKYVLRQNAGCSFLGEYVPNPMMTKNACMEIEKSVILSHVNWVILSFVASPEEITDFVAHMHKRGIKVMAKIETKEGVSNILALYKIVDGFMIGRGDLKNTSKEEYNSLYSKALNELSRMKGVFRGVGTFFLSKKSEINNLSEDEVKDIEKVKKAGLDFIMLSKEVVNSNYPKETILTSQSLCQD